VTVYIICHNNLLLNRVRRNGLNALLTGGFIIYINDILEFIKMTGLQILVVERLSIL